jgi:hypothetical protein
LKKIFIIIGIVLVVGVAAFYGMRAYTKSSSPSATAVYDKGGLKIQVEYCRPSKKGRVVFGQLEPYGKVWRTGANEATEITFNQPVSFGDKPVAAGTYTLFTIPQPDQWTVILNSELDQWGAFNYNEGKDVVRVQVPATQTPQVTEMFTIDFQDANNRVDMQLAWDQTKVVVPIGVGK